ncbi:MAG TPA: SRPBCC domain-containing protein [Myxococcaceae bacterium]|nr:SRPBCC domain-containing protein [Myxococcaceae bacterium]
MPETETVEVRMRVAARPSTVFAFLSDPDRFRQWMGEGASLEPGVGGTLSIPYPDGERARGAVLELVRDQRIVFSWGYEGGKHGLAAGSTRVSIELAPIPSGTLVTLRHAGIPRADTRREHAMGWRHYLSVLGNAAAAVAGHAEAAVDAYQAAWAETDAAKRTRLLASCWSEEGIFRDAQGYADGRLELSDYIGAAQRFAANIRFERDGGVLVAHGFVSYRWRFLAPDGSVVMRGSNFGELSPEGLFLSMTGFWEPPRPPAA